MPLINDVMKPELEQGKLAPHQGGEPTREPGEPADPNAPMPVEGEWGTIDGTEEEQQQYNQIMAAIFEVLYSDETNPGVINLMEVKMREGDPGLAMAYATMEIVVAIDEESGGQIPEDMIIAVTEETGELLTEMAVAAGLFPPERLVDKDFNGKTVKVPNDQTMGEISQAVGVAMAEVYEVDPEDIRVVLEHSNPDEIERIRAEQDAIANPQPQQQAPPQEQGVPV